MTTPGESSTPTALDLLFGPGTDAAEALADRILSPGGDQNLGRALAHLPEMTRKAAVQEAATAASALLKVDLIDVLSRGWREHRDIVAGNQAPADRRIPTRRLPTGRSLGPRAPGD